MVTYPVLFSGGTVSHEVRHSVGKVLANTASHVMDQVSQSRLAKQTTTFQLKNLLHWNLYIKFIIINSRWWYLCHVPSTFATVHTHANVFFVFLLGSISKEWHQIVSANCDWGEFTGPISSVHRSFREHLRRPKIAHGCHNDVGLNFRDIHGLQLVMSWNA